MGDEANGASGGSRTTDAAAAQERLTNEGVRLVAGTFVDLAGVSRVKAVPVERLAEFAEHGVGMSYVSTVFTVDDQIVPSPGFETPTGDMRLRPDLDALVVLPDAPGLACAPADQDDQELWPMSACPRHTLKRIVAKAEASGITFRMATEVEFTLLDSDGQPVHRGPGYGARTLSLAADFAVDLAGVLHDLGIEVEQIHPEAAPSQFEVSIAPGPPVVAGDHNALLRDTIIRVARRHGCEASFAPRSTQDTVGNGAHLHLSAWSQGHNLMAGGEGRDGLTVTGEAFVAGVLEHLPELAAVLTPSVPSYARLQPSRWAGAYTCWGLENREAALRVVRGTVGARARSGNVEVKPIDGSANQYLVMALVIAAGLDGVTRNLRLPDPVSVDPVHLSEAERRARGIKRLPTDLGVAIEAMANSELVREALGEPLFEAFLAVRRREWETFGATDLPAQVAAHRWRYG
ncbi:MAG: glutamine synthetase family protein [Ornithinimicrobium sp.]